MNNLMWLVRVARWVRNPPSPRMVALVLAVIAMALAIVGLEYFGLWPEWATMERQRGVRLPRP